MAFISGVNFGGALMIKLVIDVVLFSSMFAFVSGIVLAATLVFG
jgi:hypothetical protein